MNLKRTDAKGNNTVLTAPSVAWTLAHGGPGSHSTLAGGPVRGFRFIGWEGRRGRIRRWKPTLPGSDRRADRRGIRERLGLGCCWFLRADNNLYGVDLLAAKVLWTFASGAPIAQEPMVADQDIYTINTAGNISQIDPANGEPRWTRPTQGGRLASVSETKLYLRSYNLDLFVMDRKTGRTIVDPGETHLRAGLNLA